MKRRRDMAHPAPRPSVWEIVREAVVFISLLLLIIYGLPIVGSVL